MYNVFKKTIKARERKSKRIKIKMINSITDGQIYKD